jgi:outer membrane protein assembly factor BamE (lipoprotein component of BamABCDE complex)
MKVALFRISTAVGAALLLSGCAGILAHKGAVLDPQLASSIQPGIDNKASVEKLLGRPSFTGQFTPDDWYYV